MSILNALYFIPAFVSGIWVIMFAFKKKTITQWLLMCLLMLCVYYHISYGLYISPWTDYRLMVRFDVINMPVSMAILAINIAFLQCHRRPTFYHSPLHTLLYMPMFVYMAVGPILYHLVGYNTIAELEQLRDQGTEIPAALNTPAIELHSLVSDTIFNGISAIVIVFTIYLCWRLLICQGYKWGNIYRFFFKGQSTTSTSAVCVMDAISIGSMLPIAMLGRSWMISHPIVGACIALFTASMLHLLCYVEYLSDLKIVSLYSLSHLNIIGPESEITKVPATTNNSVGTSLPATQERTPLQSSNSDHEDDNDETDLTADIATAGKNIPSTLTAQIKRAFDEEFVYRDSNLSIKSLADRLGTNRTTLSLAINQLFGLNFRQLVANYRIEAAKAYMLKHPEATQETIAMECGYTSAQAFNIKFKEVTGLSPRVWLAQN